MQLTKTCLNSTKSRVFAPPPPKHDELIVYWAFVAERLARIKARRVR